MSHKPEYLPHEHEEPDAWHRHTADEGAPQTEHASSVNSAILLVVFVACLLFVAATIAASILYFRVYTNDLKIARIENTELSKGSLNYRTQTEQRLTGYMWSDAAAAQAGRVSVPIDEAMSNVINRYQSKGN
ncbi:MAG: hypothetical protein ACKVW3_08920 [Phycisphaerales bacterium]